MGGCTRLRCDGRHEERGGGQVGPPKSGLLWGAAAGHRAAAPAPAQALSCALPSTNPHFHGAGRTARAREHRWSNDIRRRRRLSSSRGPPARPRAASPTVMPPPRCGSWPRQLAGCAPYKAGSVQARRRDARQVCQRPDALLPRPPCTPAQRTAQRDVRCVTACRAPITASNHKRPLCMAGIGCFQSLHILLQPAFPPSSPPPHCPALPPRAPRPARQRVALLGSPQPCAPPANPLALATRCTALLGGLQRCWCRPGPRAEQVHRFSSRAMANSTPRPAWPLEELGPHDALMGTPTVGGFLNGLKWDITSPQIASPHLCFTTPRVPKPDGDAALVASW